MTFNLKIESISIQLLDAHQFQELINHLTRIERKVDTIVLSEQELTDLLNKIDTTTNHTASNIQVIADTNQKISDEIDTFLAATPAGTVITEEMATKLQGIADRSQAVSDAADAQVAVLQGIAVKGAPIVTEPPPPVVVP